MTVKQQYQRERRRIQSFIRRNEKKGFVFAEALPKIPKKITPASVRRLEKLTPNKLYEKATYVDILTGELTKVKGQTVARRLVRETTKEQARIRGEIERAGAISPPPSIPSGADIVISNFRFIVESLNDAAVSIINSWLDNLISKEGKERVAILLEEASEAGVLPDVKVSYDEARLLERLSDMLNYLPLTEEETRQWNNSLDEMEDWDDFE